MSRVISFPHRGEPPTVESLEAEIAQLHAAYTDRYDNLWQDIRNLIDRIDLSHEELRQEIDKVLSR